MNPLDETIQMHVLFVRNDEISNVQKMKNFGTSIGFHPVCKKTQGWVTGGPEAPVIYASASTYSLISRQISIFDQFCVKNAQKYGRIRNPHVILRRHVPNQKVKISFFGDPGVSTFKNSS